MSRTTNSLRPWMLQRISAVYLGAFLVYVLTHLLLHPHPGYDAWRGWFAQPLVATGCAGFVLALLGHAWVGLRDIVLDYVHHLGLRVLVQMLIVFLLTGCGIWTLRVLLLAGIPA